MKYLLIVPVALLGASFALYIYLCHECQFNPNWEVAYNAPCSRPPPSPAGPMRP